MAKDIEPIDADFDEVAKAMLRSSGPPARVPDATHRGILPIGGLQLEVYVLEDDRLFLTLMVSRPNGSNWVVSCPAAFRRIGKPDSSEGVGVRAMLANHPIEIFLSMFHPARLVHQTRARFIGAVMKLDVESNRWRK